MTKASGKSAKEYRLERDAALAMLDVSDVSKILEKVSSQRELDDASEESKVSQKKVDDLLKRSKEETEHLVFKAVDRLVKENRLLQFELSDECILRFKL